jgi:hypothetical protein
MVGARRQTAFRAFVSLARRAAASSVREVEKEAPIHVALGSAVAGAVISRNRTVYSLILKNDSPRAPFGPSVTLILKKSASPSGRQDHSPRDIQPCHRDSTAVRQ